MFHMEIIQLKILFDTISNYDNFLNEKVSQTRYRRKFINQQKNEFIQDTL